MNSANTTTEKRKLTTKQQAIEYVGRVGKKEAKSSVHYATANICHCGTCFCCEVKKAIRRAI